MASTRDKNSAANYCLEQKGLTKIRDNLAYYYAPNGHAYNPGFAEFYIASHMPNDILSYNPTDIESSLLGINSNNLVNPMPQVVPQLKKLPTVSFFDRQKVFHEDKCSESKNERPIIF
jgi:hypothetical protein